MLHKKTAIIVGAGASFELGLPLGDKLRGDIASLIDIRFDNGYDQSSGDYQIAQALRNYAQNSGGSSFNNLLHKCWLLRDALPGAISIDNLIDAHRSDEEIAFIGKLAIAKAILAAERVSNLKVDPRSGQSFKIEQANGSWLIPLFQKLTEGVAKEDAGSIFDNVDFIVFNCDRCLEYFLPRALCAYYGFSDQEADEVANRARILHPYGQVGGLSRNHQDGFAEFGDDNRNLEPVTVRIRTFSEGLRHESHREQLQNIMQNAENLVFLGFAFHPMNMEILKLDGQSKITNIFGTTVGLADAAVKRVREDIFATIAKRPDDGQVAAHGYLSEVGLEHRGAADFLYAHFRSLD